MELVQDGFCSSKRGKLGASVKAPKLPFLARSKRKDRKRRFVIELFFDGKFVNLVLIVGRIELL